MLVRAFHAGSSVRRGKASELLRPRWGVPVVVVVIGVSACTSAGGTTEGISAEGGAPVSPHSSASGQRSMTTDGEDFVVAAPSAEQVAAIEDGVVTRDEYEAGFLRFEACMEKIGISLIGGVVSADVISYSYMPQGTVEEENCYYAEYDQIDGAWQVENGDRKGDLDFLGTCLEKYGIDPDLDPAEKPSRQVESLESQVADAGIDLGTCPLPSP
jgi:hypothetical protein